MGVQVMECSWAGLVRKVSAAEDLDQVISAHDKFLEQITAQCLLDQESQVTDRQTLRNSERAERVRDKCTEDSG